MIPKTLVLLAAIAMATLLSGCGGTQQDRSRSQVGSSPNQQSEAANINSAGACTGSNGADRPQQGPGEVSNGKIVFARRIASGTDIYVIDVDGTHETRLTRTAPAEVYPGWSPDGEKIAFVRNATELYVINADGSGLKHLGGATYEAYALYPPVWSPDGQNIAFVTIGSDSSEHNYDALYVVNADGTKQTQLTKTTNSEYVEVSLGPPSWSPTGSKIAFSGYTDPSSSSDSSAESVDASADAELSGIYLINADGTGLCKLISIRTGPSHVADPVWSPDGKKIAYFCRTDRGGDALCVINPDGSGRKVLTGEMIEGTYDPPQQAWSPDGQRIAFINDSGDLDVINADGTERRRLANAGADSSSPTWSPDAEKIAFFCPLGPGASTTDRASPTDLCVINADGTEWTRLVLEVDATVNNPLASWGSG